MSTRRRNAIRLPAHIRALVNLAGRENVFWTTARRQRFAPEPGGGVEEMTNSVVGSPHTATQGTPSDQPIWKGTHYECAGDDEIAAPADLVTGHHCGAIVADRTAGTSTYEIVHRQDTTTDSGELEIRTRSDTDLWIRRTADDGTLDAASLTATDLANRFAAVWTYRSGEIKIWGDDGQGRYSASQAHTATLTYSQIDWNRWHHRFGGLFYTGSIYAQLEADIPLDDTQAHDLLDGLCDEWSIS